MTEYIATYIDDEQQDAENHIRRLKRVGGLNVQYASPNKELDLGSIHPETQLFFVDWELDAGDEGNRNDSIAGVVNYKGGTLATRLREQFEHLPIVLITREGILDERLRNRYISSLIFDDYIPKISIVRETKQIVKRAISLIEGFQTLNRIPKNWVSLLDVLGANELEGEILGEASPPLYKDNHSLIWSVPELARWIRRVVLQYPGIVYDSLHAATFLGISEQDFLAPELQQRFASAQYTGIFQPESGRWWRGRLLSLALELISQAGRGGSSVNRDFAPAYESLSGRSVQRSECVYSKKQPADWVCYVLKKPVLIDYSLSYHPDTRPPVMDEARVSFKAIRESNNVFEEYFEPSSKGLLETIRNWASDEL